MNKTDCHFCDVYNLGKDIFLFGDYYVKFDLSPVSPGHTVIVTKKHIPSVTSLTKGQWIELQKVIKKTLTLIEKTDFRKFYKSHIPSHLGETSTWYLKYMLKHPGINKKPEGYNHGINEGRAAGRTIDHLHWHIIPRYSGDVPDATGGVRNVIPELGNYKKPRK